MTDQRRVFDIKDLADALNARIHELVGELLPQAVRAGGHYQCGSLAGEPGQSLKIHASGFRQGYWKDFGGDDARDKGDALDLVAGVLYHGDKKKAFSWAVNWLGWDNSAPRPKPQRREPPAAIDDKQTDEGKRRSAQALWLAGMPQLLDTPVDRYLMGRGIDLRRLPRIPGAIRYCPSLWNVESQKRWPAMVAAINNAGGEFIAVHRTWLQLLPGGAVSKAPLEDPKMTLGKLGGGCIRLWRGASNKRLPEMPEDEFPVVVEGIENGFSVAIEAPELRVLVAISLTNLAQLWLPDHCKGFTWFADNDPTFKDGELTPQARGLARALQSHQQRGREIRLARSPEGKDANDLLRAGA